jgi:hypothetical protein
MTETTRCQACGVLDALGRHDGTCSYALEVGLPRLAEGEDPIDPEDEGELGPEDPNLESGYDGPVAEEGEVSPNHPAHPRWHQDSPAVQRVLDEDRPGDIQRAPSQATHALTGDMVAHQRPDGMWEPRPRGENPDAGLYTGLWVSYRGDRDDGKFDAVIFATELDALRHAVKEGYNVHPLELGRSLREQVEAI